MMELEVLRTLADNGQPLRLQREADEFSCMAPLLPERMSATSQDGRITVTLNQPRAAEA